MIASPVAMGAGAVMIGTGIALLPLRDRAHVHVASFALLTLWGAATIATSAVNYAQDPEGAIFWAKVTIWYSIPLPFLFVLVAPRLAGARRVGVAARSLLFVLGSASIVALIAFAIDDATFLSGVPRFPNGYRMEAGPLLYFLTGGMALSQAVIAVIALRIAHKAPRSTAAQERARSVSLAAAILPTHVGAFFLAYVLLRPPSIDIPLFWIRAVASIAAGLIAAVVVLRLGGRIVFLFAGLAAAVGIVDGIVGARREIGVVYPGYETSTLIVRSAFALLLAIAVLRFGLADVGSAGRIRAGRAAGVLAGGATAVTIIGVTSLVVGASPIGFGLAIVVGASAPVALRAPLARAGRALAARLLLPPDDPRAVAERARTYAAAVAAARGAGVEGDKLLAAMREDLGITEKEHELLVHGVTSRDQERYHTVQSLGTGATADVSLAVDEVAGKRVVVKRFRALRDPARVLREARAMAAVRHPRVVPFLEVDRRGDEVYLVLAYAEGGSARQLLDKTGPLGVQRAVDLTTDLLDGLEALHAQGIVHCDVKPENLLLDAEGRGMLGDFGSAKFAAPDVADATLTGAGAEGSLSTVSPEALRGAPPAPTRDVYAAGALLYRLLTGQHYVALEEATVFEARERITLDAPRLPHPRVPASVEAVLRKALAKRPENRYQSAREMRDAFG